MMNVPQKTTMLSPEESLALLRTFLGTRVNHIFTIHFPSGNLEGLNGLTVNHWSQFPNVKSIEYLKGLVGSKELTRLQQLLLTAFETVQTECNNPASFYVITRMSMQLRRQQESYTVKISPVRFDKMGNPSLVAILLTHSPINDNNFDRATIVSGGGLSLWQLHYQKDYWQLERTLTFTPREIEVMSLSAAGFSITQIADKIYTSPSTVNKTKQAFIKKMNCTNSMQAIRMAQAYNLLNII